MANEGRGRLYLNTAECLVMNHRQSEPSRGQLASAKTVIPVDDHSNALRTAIWPGDSDNNSPPTVLSSNAGEEEGGGRDPAAPFRRYMDSFAASGQKLGAYPPPTILPDPPRGYFYHPAIVTGEGIMGCFRGGAFSICSLLLRYIYIYIRAGYCKRYNYCYGRDRCQKRLFPP